MNSHSNELIEMCTTVQQESMRYLEIRHCYENAQALIEAYQENIVTLQSRFTQNMVNLLAQNETIFDDTRVLRAVSDMLETLYMSPGKTALLAALAKRNDVLLARDPEPGAKRTCI